MSTTAVTVAVSMNEAVHTLLSDKGTKAIKTLADSARTVHKGKGTARVIDATEKQALSLEAFLTKQAAALITVPDGEKVPIESRQLARFATQVAERIPASIEKAKTKAEEAAAKATEKPADEPVKDEAPAESPAAADGAVSRVLAGKTTVEDEVRAILA